MKALPAETDEAQVLTQWFALSCKLQVARIPATENVAIRVNLDRFLPDFTIRNNGCSDVNLSAEEAAKFTGTLEFVSSTLKQSHEANEAIQKERLPMSNIILHQIQSTERQVQPSVGAFGGPRST